MNLHDLKECAMCGSIKYLREFYQRGPVTDNKRDDMCKKCRNHEGEIAYQERKAKQ